MPTSKCAAAIHGPLDLNAACCARPAPGSERAARVAELVAAATVAGLVSASQPIVSTDGWGFSTATVRLAVTDDDPSGHWIAQRLVGKGWVASEAKVSNASASVAVQIALAMLEAKA